MAFKSKEIAKEYNKKYAKERRKNKRDEINAQKRRWRAHNPKKAREASFNRHLRNTYGISREIYDAMLAAQAGVCAICKQNPDPDRRLSVDHDHTTEKVRSLLCGLCNYGLGAFKDDPLRLQAAILYLTRHKENVS